MDFKIRKKDYIFSMQQRIGSTKSGSDLYYEMYLNDNILLEDMIESYKKIIKSEGLDYMESMEMVVTSIQSIPYVLVSLDNCPKSQFGLNFIDDCKPQKNPSGCCGLVVPFGVYTPIEFAVQRTADCDTRSLFAYTILKKLGFDVAVMVSKELSHSVLGVSFPKTPSDGKTGNIGNAKRYFLWELTTFGPVLGQDIDGNDWKIALN